MQTKTLAVLLGPSGTGLAGSYVSAVSLISTVSGMGISFGGVRQIAAANGTGDVEGIAHATITLRRTALVSGLVGMLIVLLFSETLSRTTFGTGSHSDAFALVSLTLLFGAISSGQNALLQGLRRLRELALSQILGLAAGAIASITCVMLLREKGIALFLVTSSAFGILLSWWFARKVKLPSIHVSWRESICEARVLVAVGFSFVVAGLMSSGTDYLTRIWIVREAGLDAVGHYQATWTLGAYYVSVVTGAMAADFFPHLTSVANDDVAVNRLVNEQIEIGLLLALPGVVATMVLAPLVLRVFYSGAFVDAAEVVRWQIFGVLLRVASWPLGMVLQAKGKATLFLVTELAFYAIAVPAYLIGIRNCGLIGWGVAFSLAYCFYLCGMLTVCRWQTGFRWSRDCFIVLVQCLAIAVVAFLLIRLLTPAWGLGVGAVLVCLVTYHSVRTVDGLLGISIIGLARSHVPFLRRRRQSGVVNRQGSAQESDLI